MKVEHNQQIAEKAYDTLRDQILIGQWPVGSIKQDKEIAKNLKEELGGIHVLETKVAIAHLRATGLVRLHRGDSLKDGKTGYEVIAYDCEDVSDIVAMRAPIEDMIASRIAYEKGKDPDFNFIDKMDAILSKMSMSHEADNSDAFMKEDTNFHKTIAVHAGYHMAARQFGEWRDIIQTYRATHPLAKNDRAKIIGEHIQIVNGITSGDEERAGEAVIVHFEKTVDRLQKNK